MGFVAGVDGSIVVEKVREGKGAIGYNAQTLEYEDLVKAGVIDPTKVVRMSSSFGLRVSMVVLPVRSACGTGDGGGRAEG